MIDLLVLEQMNTFAVVGQQHKGWIAFCQVVLHQSISNRTSSHLDCHDRIRCSHVSVVCGLIVPRWAIATWRRNVSASTLPIRTRIVFWFFLVWNAFLLLVCHQLHPMVLLEGTCVNNEYCVQFKKGAFEMGAEVCPIAMKYNKIFGRNTIFKFSENIWWLFDSWCILEFSWRVVCRAPFASHDFVGCGNCCFPIPFKEKISWMRLQVCDVWYLEPQRQMPNESAIDFASRVKAMIAEQVNLVFHCSDDFDCCAFRRVWKTSTLMAIWSILSLRSAMLKSVKNCLRRACSRNFRRLLRKRMKAKMMKRLLMKRISIWKKLNKTVLLVVLNYKFFSFFSLK